MPKKIKAETVITGHTNADFDCLAAIVAAGKLYPDAVLIFPGSQEKNLRNFYIQSATYLFNFVAAKKVDPDVVETLVVVDTRQRSRLGHVEKILERDDVAIHVYDHHPETDEDIEADKIVYEEWGSTSTILTTMIREKGIEVLPQEATIMGLGIYEDTGSFTFNSTTGHDFDAAAWLLERGMELNVLSDLLTRDLTAEQVELLNQLLQSASTHDINGVEVVIAEATSSEYVSDFALLVHKMMDMESIRVLFALGRMGDRVTVVSRSRTQEVDVSRICESFGGGGHPFAASATVKDRTLNQVKDELFGLLYSLINPHFPVGEFMSSPAVSVHKTQTMQEATELMTRFGLKAVPVTDAETGRPVGLLEHQVADKAVSHGLGDVEVREYMGREVTTVRPDSDLYDAMEIILGQRQRLVPVIENTTMVGVLTRTDLIKILIEEPARIPESLQPEKRHERSVSGVMRERLPEDVLAILRRAGELAEENGFEVYVVGGFVRDMLLGDPNLDVDLVVEGDGIAFARTLAASLDGRVKVHRKFKTAVVVLPDDKRIDVATARLEYYEYPAALPTVQLSSIKMDLNRRDFTINALAVHLNPKSFGHLVDFFGAQRDLKERTIRVLHSLSFVEDPTRILRAIRFEQRNNFHIGAQTERLIKNAVQMSFLQRLSGSRIFNELKLIFNEKNARLCLTRMEEFGLLSQVHAGLTLTAKKLDLLEKMEEVLDWHRLLYLDEAAPEPWKMYFLCLCDGFEDQDVTVLCERLALSKREHREFAALRDFVDNGFQQVAMWKSREGASSELFFILSPLPLEGVLFLMAKSRNEEVRKAISKFITHHRYQELDVTGEDLKALGLAPGPAYSEILDRIRAARIDGLADCREDQLDLARKLAGKLPDLRNDNG